jgi:septal ring-binding cell division protein DamX
MVNRYGALCVVLSMGLSGACSLIDDAPASEQDYKVPAGTVRESGDWSCVANEQGAWECQESKPEPAYVPTLPEYDKNSGELAARSVAAVESAPEQAPASAPEPEPAPAPEPEPKPTLIASAAATVAPQSNDDAQISPADAYVLQLAAHNSLKNAQDALTVLDAPGAEIVKTRGEGGEFFVIVAGSYASHSEAVIAAADFQTRNAGLDYWIREAQGFREAQ